MKSIIVSIIAILATFFAQSTAEITLGAFPEKVYIGQNYTLNWAATADYTYDLFLVQQAPNEGARLWDPVQGIASGLYPRSRNASYTWTVPYNISTMGSYALYLSGLSVIEEFSGANNYALTDWFNIFDAASATSTFSFGDSSTTPGPTASATSGGVSSTISSGASSATSSGSSSSSHGTSISGGAIAGIVIGAIVLIALIVGVLLFASWRRKRSAKQRREAEARAGRLAPVMQKGSDSFEMHGRSPQINKEFDP